MDLLYPDSHPVARSRRRVLLEAHLGLGDIVVITGIVRDLHATHPGEFAVGVRTSFEPAWFHNPYITTVLDHEPGVERVSIGLRHVPPPRELPVRYVDLILEEIREQTGIIIRPTRHHGDIHLSHGERTAADPVAHLIGAPVPYWILGAGGKYDHTTKWWSSPRFQEVVDHFRGRILFVQVGLAEHHHPPLNGVLDLRGRTSIRDLVRLVHHSQGVLCGVTSLMHLAAAVPVPDGGPPERPCVVLAGGREPQLLVQYPGHQFIHNVGMLPCSRGGCWKSRVEPLNDGSHLDSPEFLCGNVAGGIARCMDLISANDVVRRIEGYFEGGMTRYLQGGEITAAMRVDASRSRAPQFASQPG